ncbi:hypothetical protein BHM03_00048520 [Ensete ventricosum]|nr:hypothetical protein BHM03_00048520 [Ensete ventricosum]
MTSLKSPNIPLRFFPFQHLASLPSPRVPRLNKPRPPPGAVAFLKKASFSRSIRVPGGGHAATRCSSAQHGRNSIEEAERPPFDLNLAVVLAGFAFEAYTSPPSRQVVRE